MKKNVTRLNVGLNQDSSPQDQPKGTYRYAQNTVVESEIGDVNFLSNEEGNEACLNFPVDYIPIGKEYIGGGAFAVLLVKNDETLSEIGIVDDDCNYTTHVNFNLGFKVSKQIDITYRLRRGCERTIYFTDNHNKPRIYNFDKPQNFKELLDPVPVDYLDVDKYWDVDKFNLFKTYNNIPNFDSIEVEKDGALKPGSYNFSIQYLDEDLNPTEFITTTDTVVIYNDDFSKPFEEIRGSISEENYYQNFGLTNKSIKLTFSNLDSSYPFYRIAIITSNNGSGNINEVLYSGEIPSGITQYTYTGNNASINGTVEEVKAFNNIIEKAKHIEQIENRLILGGTKGKDIGYCKLQKFASRIETELVFKEIELNYITADSNPKRSNLHNESVGYMPGEIYSFGIVYVFADGTTSPVFHIPGKNPKSNSLMSVVNTSENAVYIDNSSCIGEDLWGTDSQGESLKGEPIRHHRFPLRSEVEKPLVKASDNANVVSSRYQIQFKVKTPSGADIPDTFTDSVVKFYIRYLETGTPATYKYWHSEVNVFNYNNRDVTSDYIIDGPLMWGFPTSIDIADQSGGGSTIEFDEGSNPDIVIVNNNVEVSYNYKEHKADIFGLNFNNILKPTKEDVGEDVVGYYIVRNERTESNKTILDNGILTPLVEEPYYVATGPLAPDFSNTDRLMPSVFNLIHPEHKFNGREYKYTTEFIKEGEYKVINKTVDEKRTEDVIPGTSYDTTTSARREKDTDGFTLHTLSRDSEMEYLRLEEQFATADDIEEVFYLDGLSNKAIKNPSGDSKEIFNVSGDNKTGILQLNKNTKIDQVHDRIPYVVMRRKLANPYSNFSTLPYYKETNNVQYFDNPVENVDIFNGDSYISPMRYTNTYHYNIKLRKRSSKDGILTSTLGVLAIIVGAIITIYSVGTGAAAGVAIAGYGVSLLATGVKKEQIAKVYSEDYDAGLRDCLNDDTTDVKFDIQHEDDEVQWFSDTLTNIWIESSVNMNWRNGATIGIPDFLNAPALYNKKDLSDYTVEKLTVLDAENSNGRLYQGYVNAELYELNPDYLRRDREKVFFALGLEYDCCSSCAEDFPHRVYYSEQSFQEELTDNYRTFLPNNYRDIEGETGKITNLFKIQNNLYIHTEEALWHLPQSFQERVTGDIVSFLGTGSFFAVPPRKILDDDTGNSGGTQHKWSTIKTPYAVFFVCESQRTVFKFDGNTLTPISNQGLFNWFKNNTNILQDDSYYSVNQRPYPYRDNPSNLYGTGFLSTYDSRKERVIFSKKDIIISDSLPNTDYEVYIKGNNVKIFENYKATIKARKDLGWKYEGLDEGRMKFSQLTTIPPILINDNRDFIFQFDISAWGGTDLTDLKNTIKTEWEVDFIANNPDWSGNVYYLELANPDDSERWLNGLYDSVNSTLSGPLYTSDGTMTGVAGTDLSDNIVLVSFAQSNQGTSTGDYYTGSSVNDFVTDATADYTTDLNNFKTEVAGLTSFKGILYPVYDPVIATTSEDFLQHLMAALVGTTPLPIPVGQETPVENFENSPNPEMTNYDKIVNSMSSIGANYQDGLWNYGYKLVSNRTADDDPLVKGWELILDIKQVLNQQLATLVDSDPTFINYEYVDGVDITVEDSINNSWTISNSLKQNSWTSWHSYLPSMYMNTPDKFYSWIHGSSNLWKHNTIGIYQKYYNTLYPHIIEYVSLSEPLQTKIWDDIMLHVEAKKYNTATDSYVDDRSKMYNKGVFYNTRQCTGELGLIVKDTQANTEDYMSQQIVSMTPGTVIVDRNERNWTLNDLRDIRIDYLNPIWDNSLDSKQTDYYKDKVLNTSTLDVNKDWRQLESLRDKYLVIRLIFDNFEDIKLIMNYSIENETNSLR